jgi:outer membrane protein
LRDLKLQKKDLDLQRNVYVAFTDAKALNAHESAIVALESRQEAYIMQKKDLMLA